MAKKKRCKNCKCSFEQKYTSLQVACTTKCAIEYAKTKKLEQEKSLNDAKLEKAKKDTLQALKHSVMTVCHKYIRERDKSKPCISCGANWNKDFQAGHFYKAELYSNLKYDEFNINGQCRKCNLRKDGNEAGYRKGFVLRYNKDILDNLDIKAIGYKQNDFKWDRELLKELRACYNKKLKELK